MSVRNDTDSEAKWIGSLPLPELRERCLWVLVICLIWGFAIAVIGISYHWGAAVRSHPHTYGYIPWWGFALVALVPLVLMSILVELVLGIAGFRARQEVR